jgi:hypothetical protein
LRTLLLLLIQLLLLTLLLLLSNSYSTNKMRETPLDYRPAVFLLLESSE